MKDLAATVADLIARKHEEEWFEFKVNWCEHRDLGEYISALSNAAVMHGKEFGYFVWGIENNTHKVIGTDFDFHQDVKNEPLQHYLARQIRPDIGFRFEEVIFDGMRLVVLVIPAAVKMPTAFARERFIRIGSSKVSLMDYPEREAQLFHILKNGQPTIENTVSEYQDLTFDKLFMYYKMKKVPINRKTFRQNLGLLTEDGKYNLMAQLLSDDSHIPIRFSSFSGKTKASTMYYVREFGNDCLLFSYDRMLDYGNLLNVPQADEANLKTTRIEVSLFDKDVFKEALVNALLHNKWVDYNAPMFTVYSDRIEILSHGTMPPKQTVEGFFMGESVPVNQKLSDLFLQLHISERSGQGVPSIVDVYGKEAYELRDNSIVVNIPFERIETDFSDNITLFGVPTDENLAIEDEKPYSEDRNLTIEGRKSAIENEKPGFEGGKLAIEGEKTSSGHQKVAIEKIYELCKGQNYNRPTLETILKVYENTDVDAVVSAPDIERITQCSTSTSKNIMNKLKKINVLVAVSGQGKGKYRFKYDNEE